MGVSGNRMYELETGPEGSNQNDQSDADRVPRQWMTYQRLGFSVSDAARRTTSVPAARVRAMLVRILPGRTRCHGISPPPNQRLIHPRVHPHSLADQRRASGNAQQITFATSIREATK